MALCRLVEVGNADVGAFGNHIHIAEVHAVRDVGKEEEVWVSTLVQYAEPAAESRKVLVTENVGDVQHEYGMVHGTGRESCSSKVDIMTHDQHGSKAWCQGCSYARRSIEKWRQHCAYVIGHVTHLSRHCSISTGSRQCTCGRRRWVPCPAQDSTAQHSVQHSTARRRLQLTS